MLRASAFVLASVLLVWGCTGGDEDGTTGRETGQAADTAFSTDGPEPRADWQVAIQTGAQRRAEAALVMSSDLGAGWRRQERGVGAVASCVGGDYSALTLTGVASSEVFQRGEIGRVLSVAQVYATKQAAADGFALLAEEFGEATVEQCVDDLLSEHPDAPEIGVTIREMPVLPRLAVDEAKAWQATITYSEEPYTAYEQVVVMRNKETITYVMTWTTLRPFKPVLEDRLLATVAARIADSS
jgi:hypothetical protein